VQQPAQDPQAALEARVRRVNFRLAKINRPNLFAPCFSAKHPKIKQFGRLISA
jgi:hypothetical protein